VITGRNHFDSRRGGFCSGVRRGNSFLFTNNSAPLQRTSPSGLKILAAGPHRAQFFTLQHSTRRLSVKTIPVKSVIGRAELTALVFSLPRSGKIAKMGVASSYVSWAKVQPRMEKRTQSPRIHRAGRAAVSYTKPEKWCGFQRKKHGPAPERRPRVWRPARQACYYLGKPNGYSFTARSASWR